jgi:hypothetical protein
MATIEQVAHLQSFPSVEAMDAHLQRFFTLSKHQLSDTRRKVLEYMQTRAVKVVGVCNAKVRTIAAAVGCSTRTVQRAIDFAVDCGLIREELRWHENGAQASTVYVFQNELSGGLSPSPVTPYTLLDLSHSSATPKPTEVIVNDVRDCDSKFDSMTFIPSYIPRNFAYHAHLYFGDPVEVTALWRAAVEGFRVLGEKVDAVFACGALTDAIVSKQYKDEKGEPVRNFRSFFKGALIRIFRRLEENEAVRQQNAENAPIRQFAQKSAVPNVSTDALDELLRMKAAALESDPQADEPVVQPSADDREDALIAETLRSETHHTARAKWIDVLSAAAVQVSPSAYQRWWSQSRGVAEVDGKLIVAVDTEMERGWLETYARTIAELAQQPVRIVVSSTAPLSTTTAG